MSIVAEFTMPARALPAGDALVERPNIRIELERIVPTRESALPFFWVWGPEPEAFMEEAGTDPNVAKVELLDVVENGALFRAEWTPDAALIRGIEQLDATIVQATGTADHWRFEVRTQERAAFKGFQEVFQDHGISVDLNRLYDLDELVDGDGQSLTPEQRETLLTAYREGYFDQPRKITQEELSEQFEVSGRAVSDRLRRGIRNLVATSLLPSGES